MTAAFAATPAYQTIETLARVAPFGVGLWDTVAHRLVSDGIAMRVFTIVGGWPIRPVAAIPNRHDVFVPHDLAGAASFDESEAPAVGSPSQTFLIEVRDLRHRYLSFAMQVGLPEGHGFVLPPCVAALELTWPHNASPPPAAVFVPLFPLASQPVPAGMAVVRASLVDVDRTPATYAVLEVREFGHLLARGVADERGEAAAIFAYPEVSVQPPWSPPAAASATLRMADQQWTLHAGVRYERSVAARPWTTDRAQPALPDLCDVLQQKGAHLGGSPSVSELELTLRYGEDMVVGELLIGPA